MEPEPWEPRERSNRGIVLCWRQVAAALRGGTLRIESFALTKTKTEQNMKTVLNKKTEAMLWTHPPSLTSSRETLAEGQREVREGV